MKKTFFGIKHDMTQAWDKQGKRVFVTRIAAQPLTVTQVKTDDGDGYSAVQVGFGNKKMKRVNKPMRGHLKLDANAKQAPRHLREIAVAADVAVGDSISVADILSVGDVVSVTASMKGKGFAGGMKRWGFGGGPRTHGQSDRGRAPGSIGQGTDPGRVHKGKKMAGHYGNETRTIKNIQVVHIDADGMLWLAGAVPGACGSVIKITHLFDGTFDGLALDETTTDSTETVVSETSEGSSEAQSEEHAEEDASSVTVSTEAAKADN